MYKGIGKDLINEKNFDENGSSERKKNFTALVINSEAQSI
jgi:hypothetical protein